jgi:hypothetical protein
MGDPVRPAALVEKTRKFILPPKRVVGDWDG